MLQKTFASKNVSKNASKNICLKNICFKITLILQMSIK